MPDTSSRPLRVFLCHASTPRPRWRTAIRVLAADKEKSRQMRLAGRKYLEEYFSRVVIGKRLVEILEGMRTRRM